MTTVRESHGNAAAIISNLRSTKPSTLCIRHKVLFEIGPRIDDYCEVLQELPLKRLVISIPFDRDLYRECVDKLGQVLGLLASLEELDIEAFNVDGLSVIASYVHRARQIRVLEVGFQEQNRDFTLDDVPAFSGALVGHPNIAKIYTRHWLPNEIHKLSMVIPTLPNLKKIFFRNVNGKPELSNDTFECLFRASSLLSLNLMGYTISVTALQTIAQHLGNESALLSSLCFSDCKLPDNRGSLLAESLKVNTALRRLSFRRCRPDSSFFTSLKDALSNNRTLLRFFLMSGSRTSMPLSEEEANEMSLTVRANYGLQFIRVSSNLIADPHQRNLIQSFGRLNRAGRSYLVKDGASIRKGVEVLSRVKDTLDCLFLHLTENPWLCRPQVVPGRKRKRGQST